VLIRHSKTVDKTRRLASFPHPLGDGFAAAMDEYRVNPHTLEKDDVTKQALNEVVILHCTAAILNNEGLTSELLNEW
jgi:hypothetical protein